MLTIAFLYDSILNVGGVESHLLSILKYRDTNRFSYVLISEISKKFLEKVKAFDVEVISFKSGHPLNPLTPFRLVRILREKKVDLFHAHSPTASLWGRYAARLVKVPFVATVHLPVSQYHGRNQSLRARYGRKIYTKMDYWLNHNPNFTKKLIYVSQEIFYTDISSGHSPADSSIVIPNGIDLSQFNEINRIDARKRYELAPETKVITFVGRLEEQKGSDILLNAVEKINSLNIDFKVWLIGDGSLRADLENNVRLRRLADRVKFWGYQEDIPVFLKASDIFVLPSRYEGMSFGLLMGMAAGLPCVVTNVGENARLIEDHVHGLVVRPEDDRKLASALKKLLLDPDLSQQLSKAAFERSNFYSEEIMVKRTTQVYNEALGFD